MNIKVLMLLVLFSLPVLAQRETGVIRGYVTDLNSGEKLAFCNVSVDLTRRVSTNSDGYFIISRLPANRTYSLRVSYIGYETIEIPVKVIPYEMVHLNIELKPTDLMMQTVVKTGEKVNSSNALDIGLENLVVRELELFPQSVETDVIRSLQNIAGVQAIGDMGARYYVRGGESNQNLILLDGMTVYNPYHAFGLFSVLEPEIISSMEFYKGGYPAEYAQRLSSVLRVNSKFGNKKEFKLTTSLSFLSAKLLAEGPLFNGSFFVSARKSISTDILTEFNSGKEMPMDFYDITFKAHFDQFMGSKHTKVAFTGFASKDVLEYSRRDKEDYDWGNQLLGVNVLRLTESPLFMHFNFYYSGYKAKIFGKDTKLHDKSNRIQEVNLSGKFIYVYDSKDEITFGFDTKTIQSTLDAKNKVGTETDYNDRGTLIDLYGKYKVLRYENFGLDLGCRVNLATLNKRDQNSVFFEPRISFTFAPTSLFKLKGGFGVYHQELTTFDNEKDILSIFEPWIIAPEEFPISESYHYTLGMESSLNNFVLKVEGYYNDNYDIPSPNNKKTLSSDPDFRNSSTEAYGVETQLDYNTAKIFARLTYTHAYAYKDISDWIFYPKQDIRNSLKFNFTYLFENGLSVGMSWAYNSGMPFTKNLGFYHKMDFGDYDFLGDYLNNYSPYQVIDDINLGRLPDYHRLDISVTKKYKWSFAEAEISLNLINVYDRKNLFYFRRETGERVYMLPFLPTAKIKLRF